MRVRQYAQFELVKRKNISALKTALQKGDSTIERLHGLWGLAQLQRARTAETAPFITQFINDKKTIIRQHICQSLGDFTSSPSHEALLIQALSDPSQRVKLKAAIALGKVGTEKAKPALWKLIATNKGKEHIIRHISVRALARLKDQDGAIMQVNNKDPELRLAAVLVLRELESAELAKFVKDENKTIREEAIRAIYDKQIMAAMPALAVESHNIGNYSLPLQRRILFSNMWLGTAQNASNTIAIVNNPKSDKQIKEFALRALSRWSKPPENDPIFSLYRPTTKRNINIIPTISKGLTQVLEDSNGKILDLALKLAQDIKLPLSPKTLLAQVNNTKAPANIRISALNTLLSQDPKYIKYIPVMLKKEKNEILQGRLIELSYAHKLTNYNQLKYKYLSTKNIPQSRAIIKGLAMHSDLHPQLAQIWAQKKEVLPPEVFLDLYLAMKTLDSSTIKTLIAKFDSTADNAYNLTTSGGNSDSGKTIFEGQGACLQCHQINRKGGAQGPALDGIGTRQNPHTIMESLIHPNKLIAPGFGTFIVNTKGGKSIAGILLKEDDTSYQIKTASESLKIMKKDVANKQGPSSGMPPIARALKLSDLRDLIAYLESIKESKVKKRVKSSH
ncbi:HEAT repeat domain-containing protein [Lentisphaera profundi]|uniref:HEAT repeat domain-containing protein n=1 Tax=Lentisphaera profundi TaxID=1658616 RepID=A0ABY7VW68_9BACT|nr:HEAT repeat domain-containing protein [Lentisphaera profundi]WDE97450.1 HEAT repeat domain-containing protein [Lentisphaera profundi]